MLLNLDAKICRVLVLEILPALRLLDPACGSGAFLVAAMKVLINIYSAILGKVELEFLGDPDLKKWHDEVHGDHRAPAYYIKKRIITENLFGVDIMEEATEIARLRLFLALVASAQTEDQLEPLPNIDFNILAGNSLIGLLHVDPKKFDGDEVGRVSPLRAGAESADGGAHGVTRPTQGRMTLVHQPGKGDLGFTVETKTAPTAKEKQSAFMAQKNAEKFAAILEDKNKSIELYRRHAFGSFGVPPSGGQVAAGRSTVQPPKGGTPNAPSDFADLVDQNERVLRLREHIEKVRGESYARLNQMLLDEFSALGIQFEQATWDDKKNDTGKPEKRRLELSDLEALHPFHWGYEFDKVMADGGFDGIITNPPWEIFKPQAKEFFDDHSDLVTKNKMTIKEFEKEQAKLLKNPEIREAWLEFLSRYPHVSLYFRNAEQFKNQIATVNGKKAGTDINLYKLFLEQSFRLLHEGGQCGILTPGSIYTDLGAKQLRELLFSQTQVTALFGLTNEKWIFEGIHHAQKFCVLTFSKGGSTSEFEAAFRINPREAITPEHLDGFLHDRSAHVTIPVRLIQRLAPDSLSIVEFRGSLDMSIAEKLARFPLLGEKRTDVWNFVLRNEFHITNDSHLFRTKDGDGRLPLFTGRMFNQFCLSEDHSGYWIDEEEGRKALLGKTPDDNESMDYEGYRWVHRRIAASTNERTLICTITPRNVFTEVNSTVISPKASRITAVEMLFLTAITNSFCLDWLIRNRVTNTLNMFYVYQLPVPRLTAADAAFGPIVKRAAQLICTTPEFDALAKEVGLGSHKSGVTAPAARAQLRAELDGLIACLYALTESEFAHILTTFPLVAQPVKDAALESYRAVTKGGLK